MNSPASLPLLPATVLIGHRRPEQSWSSCCTVHTLHLIVLLCAHCAVSIYTMQPFSLHTGKVRLGAVWVLYTSVQCTFCTLFTLCDLQTLHCTAQCTVVYSAVLKRPLRCIIWRTAQRTTVQPISLHTVQSEFQCVAVGVRCVVCGTYCVHAKSGSVWGVWYTVWHAVWGGGCTHVVVLQCGEVAAGQSWHHLDPFSCLDLTRTSTNHISFQFKLPPFSLRQCHQSSPFHPRITNTSNHEFFSRNIWWRMLAANQRECRNRLVYC